MTFPRLLDVVTESLEPNKDPSDRFVFTRFSLNPLNRSLGEITKRYLNEIGHRNEKYVKIIIDQNGLYSYGADVIARNFLTKYSPKSLMGYVSTAYESLVLLYISEKIPEEKRDSLGLYLWFACGDFECDKEMKGYDL